MIYKVTHAKDGIETVYLVSADSSRDACTQVLDTLYNRVWFHKEDLERLANDPFGLLAAGQRHEWTNKALTDRHGCTIGAVEFNPDPPYKLYEINTRTGVVT